jgi:4,5-DOPA dioxygenase extradiol
MNSLKDLHGLSARFQERETKMPALFIGHGSPMNGIEHNAFSSTWKTMGKEIPLPAAVLCISAHWFTAGTFVTAMENPKTIHDFYGFPKSLFDVTYPAPGSPELAMETAAIVHQTTVKLDHEWGLDHGTWSVVRNMYPEANIPVLQLSVDYSVSPGAHVRLAQELAVLRQRGVLIIGSGNLVHNLGVMNWSLKDTGYDWALEANGKLKRLIHEGDHGALAAYKGLGPAVALSVPTPEHYLPMLYALGVKDDREEIRFFNDKTVMGSVSMTSFITV